MKSRIKELERLVEMQSAAIDKGLDDQKKLRDYLENPQKHAECSLSIKYPYEDIESAYIGGYVAALNELKYALGVEYISKNVLKGVVEEALTKEVVFKWVVREKSGRLFIFECKPMKSEKCPGLWVNGTDIGQIEEIDKSLYPNVKWEDEEPTKIEDGYEFRGSNKTLL